jgi:hypothetical protein
MVTVMVLCWCARSGLAAGGSDKAAAATSPFANVSGIRGALSRRSDRAPDQLNETEDEVTTPASGCQSCLFREGLRNLSLQTIKEEILNKLGMKHAPNTTGRMLPKIPPLHHLLQIYEQQQQQQGQGQGLSGMQGDEPVRTAGSVEQEEEDDYHARTDRVIAFAQPCE